MLSNFDANVTATTVVMHGKTDRGLERKMTEVGDLEQYFPACIFNFVVNLIVIGRVSDFLNFFSRKPREICQIKSTYQPMLVMNSTCLMS